jgi:ABC-type sugar transport system permease subunit
MAVVNPAVGAPKGAPTPQTSDNNLLLTIVKYVGLAVLNAFGLILVYTFLNQENIGLAVVSGIIVLGTNIITFIPRLAPLRWMLPGLALVVLLVLYPISYTLQTAFTNMGNLGDNPHPLPRGRAAAQIVRQGGVISSPEALEYSYNGYKNDAGQYAVLLTRELEDGTLEAVFATQGSLITLPEAPAEAPATLQGFTLMTDDQMRTERNQLQRIEDWGDGSIAVTITRRSATVGERFTLYEFNGTDTITNRETGAVYIADDATGFFVNQSNRSDRLTPGYITNVGFDNFTRLFSDPRLRGPLVDIFVWTVTFSIASVILTFVFGLAMALVLNDPRLPGKFIIRSLLIIPYALPGVISIVVWRAMLNTNLGVVTDIAEGITGTRPQFLLDPWLAKFSILLVNTWLGYPYMMLVCSGALQAISSDVYEAAAVDGATSSQRFWRITLPLLLVAVGPLLIASFTFNFNNYLLIEALTFGDPPIPSSPVPAGYTDILISYTYSLAFGNDRGADYGYASAIAIVIFAIVAVVTLIQFRFTRQWEQVGENV